MNDFNEAALEAALLAMRGESVALKPTHLILSARGVRMFVRLFGPRVVAKRRGVRGRRAALYGRRS